jgi:hypothetical protein
MTSSTSKERNMKGVKTKKANRRILKKKEGLLKRAFFSPKRNCWTGLLMDFAPMQNAKFKT